MTNDTLIDGRLLFASPTPNGAKRFEFPFRKFGDPTAAYFEEDYWQLEENWTPAEFGVEHPEYPGFYLVAESPRVPLQGGFATMVTFTRTFARVPAQQLDYAQTYLLTMPSLPQISVGGLTTVCATSYVVPSGAVSRVGNYAYLSVSESGAGGNFSGYYGAEKVVTRSGDDFTCPTGHGIIIGDLVTYRDDSLANTGRGYGAVTNVVGDVVTVSRTDYATTGTPTQGGFILAAAFTADLRLRKRTKVECHLGEQLTLGARDVYKFYLPLVTAGITSLADVPNQDGFNLEDLLAAYETSSTWFNVVGSSRSRWPVDLSPIAQDLYRQCRLSSV